MLTQELVKNLFDYRQDGELIWKKKICPKVNVGGLAKGTDAHGYRTVGFYKKLYRMHRIIFLYHHGFLPKMVDHVNGNTLDNRIENLRAATPSENMMNRVVGKNSKTGVKGVSWSQVHSKYICYIYSNNKAFYCGAYVDFIDAVAAIYRKRSELHGEFARF